MAKTTRAGDPRRPLFLAPTSGNNLASASPPKPSLTTNHLSYGHSKWRNRGQIKWDAATAEPVRVRVLHDNGIAEKLVGPEDDSIGDMQLETWARITGRLMQGSQPIGDQWIHFSPLVRRGLGEARFQDSYSARTNSEGRFEMKRLPPGTGSLRVSLGPWRDSPLTSGESITLELKPGENRSVILGGEGAVLTGHVVATGRDEAPLVRNWSLNYLISRDRSVAAPYTSGFPKLSFDPSEPMQSAWCLDPHSSDWLATRDNHFVKLTPEGEFRVTGVEAGEYDLVIRLYEQPAGCLVETVGEKIVPIRVESDAGSVWDRSKRPAEPVHE